MSAIVALPGVVQSSTKQQWLDFMARQFDAFVEEYAALPDNLVLVMSDDRHWGVTWVLHEEGTHFTRAGALLLAAEKIRFAANG